MHNDLDNSITIMWDAPVYTDRTEFLVSKETVVPGWW